MQVSSERLDNDYSIQIFETISSIDANRWNAIHSNIAFYQTHQFLAIIESVHKDIQFRYVLILRKEEIIAALYVQLLDFSFRNLVNYSKESSGGIQAEFKKYIAKRNIKLLNLGNVFFTGDKGVICNNEELMIPYIPEIFKRIHASFTLQKPSAFLIANIYLQDEDKCIDFCNNAFHPFNTEPDMFMSVQENWKSFTDYMGALSSKYRVRARKVMSVSEQIIQKELAIEDVVALKIQMHHLYDNVMNHVAFNMAVLNIDFFEQMKLLYGEKCSVFGYYKTDELVGFACMFHLERTMLHVHYIGLNYDINKQYKLYNRMLLDFVKFAIEKEKTKIHFGRTATEIKTTIGAEPVPLHAYLKMSNNLVNASLPYILKKIKPAEYVARNPFKE